jgi:hypothetical protein
MDRADGERLEDFLSRRVYASVKVTVTKPDTADVIGFAAFLNHFKAGLAVEKAAEDSLNI